MQMTSCQNSMSFKRRVFKITTVILGCTSTTYVKMSSSDRLEIRVIIKFNQYLGKTPTQTLKMIDQTKREQIVSRALAFKWHRRFADGQNSLEEQDGRAGKKEQYDAMIVTSNREALAADRRLTIRDLIERFVMGYGTMHRILTEDLQMSKAILSYKFDFYMMHIAKVSDYSYIIVNRNNQ